MLRPDNLILRTLEKDLTRVDHPTILMITNTLSVMLLYDMNILTCVFVTV